MSSLCLSKCMPAAALLPEGGSKEEEEEGERSLCVAFHVTLAPQAGG